MKKLKYGNVTVVFVKREDALEPTPTSGVVMPPDYDPERDEPAFEKAWAVVRDGMASGKYKPIPQIPAGGKKLRGKKRTESDQEEI